MVLFPSVSSICIIFGKGHFADHDSCQLHLREEQKAVKIVDIVRDFENLMTRQRQQQFLHTMNFNERMDTALWLLLATTFPKNNVQ